MQLMPRRRSFRPRLARTAARRTRKLAKRTAKGIETKLTSLDSRERRPPVVWRGHGERNEAASGTKGAQRVGQEIADHPMADGVQMSGPRTGVREPARQRPT